MSKAQCKQREIGGIFKTWQESRVGDRIELAYGDGLPERARKNGPVPVFGSNGVTGFHDKALVKGPGIIIGRKGTVGQVTLSRGDFWRFFGYFPKRHLHRRISTQPRLK